jgi:hypothetical protein
MQIRRNKRRVDTNNAQANWLLYISIQLSDSLV